MRFASRQIREKMAKRGENSMSDVRNNTKKKYTEVLNFMKEWSQDLMERQNQLHQQRQIFSTTPLQQENPNTANCSLDIEQLIKQEFYKKVESLYMKQLMIADLSQNQPSQTHSLQDSLNHSRQSNNTFAEEQYNTSRYNKQNNNIRL